MASIDGKEEHDAFNSRMEEKQPSTTKASAKNSPNSQKQQFQCEKAATSSKQGQRQGTSHKELQPGLQDPKDSAGCHVKWKITIINPVVTSKGKLTKSADSKFVQDTVK
ncbi:hypothetical protein O181_117803, partial [Austropuccinia psidii MF-1]|nr:hypothetical protein [Austropuccinia psidii MF-1]